MSTSNGTIPNGHPKEDRPREIFKLSSFWAVILTVPLPLWAFIACVGISMTNDFIESTYMTCSDPQAGKVPNFLPSISSSIGAFTPQRYIWRILFALHITPRYIFALAHYNYNQGFPVTKQRSWFKLLNKCACLFHMLELSGLIVVTFISSTDNYPVHEKGFMIFVGCASMYMVMVIILFKWARHDIAWTAKDVQSYRLKWIFFVSSIICLALCFYFFNRHMAFCEPNVYSFFALFEYLMVISNMCFHLSWMLIEFNGGKMYIGVPVRPGQYTSLGPLV